MVLASDDFEMVAPVELSIFCFRHVPVRLRDQSPEAIDAFNERLLVALQRDGSSYLSNATLPRRALRLARLRFELSDDVARYGDSARRFATRSKIASDFCLGNEEAIRSLRLGKQERWNETQIRRLRNHELKKFLTCSCFPGFLIQISENFR